ncbi:hypothetical protein HDE_00438 [Halotydeus destructor]|nr:hypothetical protein HDE_00438 [Halotydeus destructor]
MYSFLHTMVRFLATIITISLLAEHNQINASGTELSFCSNVTIDASFFDERDKTLTIFRGPYYWVINASGSLPFKSPEDGKRKLIKDFPLANKLKGPTEVDAAAIIGENVILIQDNQVYTNGKQLNLTQWLNVNIVTNESLPFEVVDALWYNKMEGKLYVISQDVYVVARTINGSLVLILDPLERDFVDFYGLHKDIDAVFSLADGYSYFTKTNWFYKLPQRQWLPSNIPYGAQEALGSSALGVGLWNTKESCNLTTEQFERLRIDVLMNHPPDEWDVYATIGPEPEVTLNTRRTIRPTTRAHSQSYSGETSGQTVASSSANGKVWLAVALAAVVATILVTALWLTLSQNRTKPTANLKSREESFGPTELFESKNSKTSKSLSKKEPEPELIFEPEKLLVVREETGE